ncbi:MAG: hypothetical protein J6S85_17970 [Methanobrevibacter sp.]|nr:hypothetical protein [Methanobrevibacter sp.]
MEFTIDSFTKRLRELMYNRFPYENDEMNILKHKDRNEHIRDVAFKNNQTISVSENEKVFEIGNDYAEQYYPYYHILEDAPYIRKRDRATDKTRGSQAKVEKLADRDYNKVSFNGKTYTREYARNVRGKRSRLSNVSYWASDGNGDKIWINRESNSYLNTHYQYIERMMNTSILDTLAMEFNLKKARTEITTLKEDFEALNIVDIINSSLEE